MGSYFYFFFRHTKQYSLINYFLRVRPAHKVFLDERIGLKQRIFTASYKCNEMEDTCITTDLTGIRTGPLNLLSSVLPAELFWHWYLTATSPPPPTPHTSPQNIIFASKITSNSFFCACQMYFALYPVIRFSVYHNLLNLLSVYKYLTKIRYFSALSSLIPRMRAFSVRKNLKSIIV